MQSPPKNRTLLFILVISLLANIVMLIYFGWLREHYHRNNARNGFNSPITVFLKKDLHFTDQQMEAYNNIRMQNRQKMKPLFEEVRMAKVHFYDYLNDQQINDSLLSLAAAQIGEKQTALDLQTLKNFRQVRELCTEEQKKQYDSLIAGVISNMWFTPRNGPPEKRK